MTTMSRPWCRVGTPGMENPWVRFTWRSSCFRSCTFRLCVSVVLERGVKRVPFRQTPFFLIDSKISLGTVVFPSEPVKSSNLQAEKIEFWMDLGDHKWGLSSSVRKFAMQNDIGAKNPHLSQLMGAFNASMTLTTAAVTSGPTPSPGIRVTVLSFESPGCGTYVTKVLACEFTMEYQQKDSAPLCSSNRWLGSFMQRHFKFYLLKFGSRCSGPNWFKQSLTWFKHPA